MLKTLKVTSLVTVILAATGVIAIVVMGLKGDPEIKDFLAKPGIVDELREKTGQEGVKDEKSSPLVALARLIALRFDPPPPPKPPTPDPIKPPDKLARVEPKKQVIPTPKVVSVAKSDLLATVLYEFAPEKSLALLKTTGNKQEWFRQGDKVGHLEIKEVRDGSVIFTQGGKNPQERFVPAKPHSKSLLKNSQQISKGGPGSITASLPASGQGQAREPDVMLPSEAAAAETMRSGSKTTDSGKVRLVRPSRSRPDVSTRIQRARSTPPPASPKEQKKSLNKTMSGIEEIMKRQNDAVSGKDRKKENEMWMRLLKELNTEKKRLDTAAGAEEPPEKDAEKTKPEQPKESTEKKTQDADKPAPADGE